VLALAPAPALNAVMRVALNIATTASVEIRRERDDSECRNKKRKTK
jgi:hypothetical protein